MASSDYRYTQQEIDDGLTALIAHAGNARAAAAWLREQNGDGPTRDTLRHWATIVHWERYEELRELFAKRREDKLANDFLDRSDVALRYLEQALEKAGDRLEKGEETDPARAAANLAKVAVSMAEKRLMLQGRPVRITEHRDVDASLRNLVAMGVIQLPDEEQAQLEAADGE